MLTTSIHPGHSVSGVLNDAQWGDGYTDEQRTQLTDALVAKFEELARGKTGDSSISYCAYTSEITYECWGQTTRDHHCTSPKTAWTIAEDEDIEWGELADEASQWVGEHAEEIIGSVE